MSLKTGRRGWSCSVAQFGTYTNMFMFLLRRGDWPQHGRNWTRTKDTISKEKRNLPARRPRVLLLNIFFLFAVIHERADRQPPSALASVNVVPLLRATLLSTSSRTISYFAWSRGVTSIQLGPRPCLGRWRYCGRATGDVAAWYHARDRQASPSCN